MSATNPDIADFPDLAWFKRNPETNYRVRLPRNGEVDELARTLLPAGMAWEGGPLAAPSPETQWHVLAIKLPLRRIARVLTLSAPDGDGGFKLMTAALGTRLAVSSE